MGGSRARQGGRRARSVWDLAPGLAGLRGYRPRARLRTDLLAGLSVAAVAIPAGLGMGALAGVGPVAGLYATMFPLLAYAVLGSSRRLVIGPEGTLSALTAVTIAPLAAGDAASAAVLAAALALLVGAIQIAAGALRLGFMARFLSRPILVGYMNGVAGIIIASQLGKLFGLDIDATGFFPRLWEIATELGRTHWPTLLLSIALIALVFALRRFAPAVPAGLIAIVTVTIASALLGLDEAGVAVVGEVARGLPELAYPHIGFEQLSRLVIPAAGLALVGFADAAAINRVYARRGDHVDDNREIVALGAANAVAGFTGAIPVGSSGSRTAVNAQAGGLAPIVALLVAAAAVAAAFATALIAAMPNAALAVVVIAAATGLIDLPAVARLRRVHDTEAALALASILGVLVFGVLGGLVLAVALSVGVFVYRSVRPHDAVLGSVSDVDGYRDIEHHPEAETVPGLVVYRFDSAIYFPNAEYFAERVLELVEPDVEWIVVNFEAVNYIDASGVEAVHSLHRALSEQGVVLVAARVRADLRRVMGRTGLAETVPTHHSVRSAVAAFRQRPDDDA